MALVFIQFLIKKDNNLVYIWPWSPEDKSSVTERYFKHIQTLTLRGSRVKFDKRPEFTLNCFLNLLANEKLKLHIK